jgi:hypothetical protein
MGSRASQRSKGGVSKNSYVDESLFGGKKAGTKAGATVISMEELRTIRSKTEKNNQTDAVIITQKDMERIKEATTIKTKEQLAQEKRLLEEQKNAALAKSKMRKAKMMEMDAQRS